MWFFIIVLIIVVALAAYLISAYNGLIRRRNQIENAWSFKLAMPPSQPLIRRALRRKPRTP